MHYNGILYTFQTPFQIKYIIFYGPSITHKNYYFCTLRCFVLFQRSLCLKFGRIGQLELKSSCRNHFVYITYEWRRRQIHNITWLQNYFCGACTNFVYYPTQRDILEISEIEKKYQHFYPWKIVCGQKKKSVYYPTEGHLRNISCLQKYWPLYPCMIMVLPSFIKWA